MFQKLNVNRIGCQAEYDMHLDTKPSKQEHDKPADNMDDNPSAGLGISQGTKKGPITKDTRKSRGGQTKIQVWIDVLKVYKHQVVQDNSRCLRVVVLVFQLFEHLLSKECCEQLTKIQM